MELQAGWIARRERIVLLAWPAATFWEWADLQFEWNCLKFWIITLQINAYLVRVGFRIPSQSWWLAWQNCSNCSSIEQPGSRYASNRKLSPELFWTWTFYQGKARGRVWRNILTRGSIVGEILQFEKDPLWGRVSLIFHQNRLEYFEENDKRGYDGLKGEEIGWNTW